MKNTILISIVLFLTGCASLSYEEPTQGPRAKVRFVTTSVSPTVLRVYDDSNCSSNETEWMRLQNSYTLNSSPKRLNMPLWDYHENAAKEVYVTANKKIYGMFFGSEAAGSTIYSCGTPFSFTFKENMMYEVKYIWDANWCKTIISNLVNSGNSWSLVELARFDNRINDTNRYCFEQFKKQRLY